MTEEKGMLKLEDDLAADSAGAFKAEVMERLQAAFAENKRVMDAGAPPSQFARLNELSSALEAAQRVVEGVWENAHSQQR